MIPIFQTEYRKDATNRKIFMDRTFDAPLENVWNAWTNKDTLDLWWAPEPWKTNTKSIQFETGGHWHYAMKGPNGQCHWLIVKYISVEQQKQFHGKDSFCDEQGNAVTGFPGKEWKVTFTAVEDMTRVKVELTFESEQQMTQLIEMGFEKGFARAHTNLDEILKKQE